PVDFQKYLISSLLLLCKKAQFLNLPLEQPKVPQSRGRCDQLDYTHFQKMPTLRFKFAKENAQLVRTFMLNLNQHLPYKKEGGRTPPCKRAIFSDQLRT